MYIRKICFPRKLLHAYIYIRLHFLINVLNLRVFRFICGFVTINFQLEWINYIKLSLCQQSMFVFVK